MELYSTDFYKEIPQYLENLKENKKNTYYLSNDEYKKQTKIVEDYLKKEKLKIYGGIALNINLPEDSKIYKEEKNKIVDYDVYTPTPKKHAVELTNLLFKNDFKYSTCREGVNDGVYKVFNLFQEVVDFVYVPHKIYTHIPYKIYDNLSYVSPEYLRIDLLVALTNTSMIQLRWKKDSQRLNLLDTNFPVTKPKTFPKEHNFTRSKNYNEDKIDKFLKSRDDYIIFGESAYYYYMESSGIKDYYKPEFKYFEIGLVNPSSIFPELRKIFNFNIKIKKFNKFLKYIPDRYIVSLKKNERKILLIIYDLSEKCIPYIENKGKKIVSFYSLILFYHFMIYLSKTYNIKQTMQMSKSCIYELIRARKSFISKKSNSNKNNPFKIYVLDCLGENKDIYMDSKKRSWIKGAKFNYVPGKRKHIIDSSKIGTGWIRDISGEFNKEIIN